MRLCHLLQAFYILSSAGILCAASVTFVRERFIKYGSRNADRQLKARTSVKARTSSNTLVPIVDFLLDTISSFQVPHWWFIHFYILSVVCSVFWAAQFVSNGRILQGLISCDRRQENASATLGQVALVWLFLLIQGIRRLYECMIFTKPSTSQMWIAHWAVGLLFYFAMSMSIWAEGMSALQNDKTAFYDSIIKLREVRTAVGVVMFFIASRLQQEYHAHLASLPKYSLPHHPMFGWIICPHYFAECLIYLSMALLAAPDGQTLNTTIFTGLLFVIVNLGVTANTTKSWYIQKFGNSAVEGRWIMIPFLY